MNYLIIACIVLFAICVFLLMKTSRLSKNLKGARQLIEDKDEIIAGYRHQANVENAKIATMKIRNENLESQIQQLVTEINKTGVRRNEKGRFVKA